MKNIFLTCFALVALALSAISASAQTATGPEQDCINALKVNQPIITQPLAYSGDGFRRSELFTVVTCLPTPGEINGTWYRVQALVAGKVSFTIRPTDITDDYNWVVFRTASTDGTVGNNECFNLGKSPVIVAECNNSTIAGPTGANDQTGDNFKPSITVNQKETLLIYVSNRSGRAGCTIDFSTSTPGLIPSQPAQQTPTMTVIPAQTPNTPPAGCPAVTTLTVRFSQAILCPSVQGGSFSLTGPGGPYIISKIVSDACGENGRNATVPHEFTLTVSPSINASGLFTLSTSSTTETIKIRDLNTNPIITQAQTFSLNVGTTAPVLTASETSVCLGRSTTLTTPDLGANAKYIWFVGNVTNGTQIAGQSGSTLQIFTTYRGEVVTDATKYYQSVNTPPVSYSVQVTDVNGCVRASQAVTIAITAEERPKITAPGSTLEADGSVKFCYGANVTLQVPAGFATYQWILGGKKIGAATNSTFIANDDGEYTVEVTTLNGCKNLPASIVLSRIGNPPPAIDGIPAICSGGSTELSINGAFVKSIQWIQDGKDIAGATGAKLTVTKAGNYQVRVLDDMANCLSTSPVLAVVQSVTPTKPNINNGSAGARLCQSEVRTLTAGIDATTNKPFSRYQWLLNGQTIVGAIAQTTNATLAGQYTVIAFNSNGCPSQPSAPFTVSFIPNSQVNITSPTGGFQVCSGDSLRLSIGASFNTITWKRDGIQIGTDSVVFAKVGGVYSVSAQSNDGNCVSSTSVTVTIVNNPSPPITTNTVMNSFCEGESLILNAGTGFTKYEWRKQGSTTVIGASQTLTITDAGTYTVTVTLAAGCSGTSAPLTITKNLKPVVPAITPSTGKFEVCPGSSIELSVPDAVGQTYQWFLNGAAIAGETKRTLTVTKKGAYTVEVTNSSGCKAKPSDANVIELPPPTAPTLAATAILCPNSSVPINAGTGYTTYQWYRNGVILTDNTAKNQIYTATVIGNYTVVVGNTSGCTIASVNATVITPSSLTVTITTSNFGATYNATSNPAATAFQWLLNGQNIAGANTSSFSPLVSGSYNVRVTDVNGCADSAKAPKIFEIPRSTVGTLPPANPTVLNNSASAAPGDTITIGVSFSSLGSIEAGAPITAILRFNATLLEPLPPTAAGTISQGIRSIPVSFTVPPDKNNILLKLPFRAALGNDSSTVIRLDSIKLITGALLNPPTNSVSATFKLLNISYAGGVRLIGKPPTIVLKPSRPNPTPNAATVEYDVEQREQMTVSVMDVYGRIVRQIDLGMVEAGHGDVSVDLSDQPPGVYFAVFQTPTAKAATRIHVAR